MRILIISHYFWPETFRINEVVESLVQEGCDVCVLTGQPNYPIGKVYRGYRAWGTGCEMREGYDIYRVPMVPRKSGSGLWLALNYASFLLSACLLGPWILRKQRFDAIFVYATTPVLHSIAGAIFKKLKGAPLVAWVQDLWPESLETTGFVRNQRVLAAVGSVVRWIYRRCDLLLVQSQAFIMPVASMAAGTRVEYHPNPGELAFGRAEAASQPAIVLEPGFNVVFAGNMGTVQALDTVLDAAEQLAPHSDIRLVFIGSGSRHEWVRQEVARRGLDNVSLPGRFPPHAMPGILAQASALLVSLVRSPIMARTVPSKVQAYLAAGRPIVASLDGEGARVIASAGAGIACPAEDAGALAQALLRLRGASPEERRRMGEAGRRCYEKDFDPTVLARRLMRLFQELALRSRQQSPAN